LICQIVGFQLHYLPVELQGIPTPGEYQQQQAVASTPFLPFLKKGSPVQIAGKMQSQIDQIRRSVNLMTNASFPQA